MLNEGNSALMSSSAVKSWRTAFLTLRDENSASPPRATVVRLLDKLILSQSHSLVAAAPQLPPHELTSDFMLLLELVRDHLSYYQQGIEDATQTFVKLSALIHGICHSSSLEMNSTMWALVCDSFKRVVQVFLGNVETEMAIVRNAALIKPTKDFLESLRLLFSLYQTSASPSENGQLLNFVLEVVEYFQGDSKHSTYFNDNYSVSRGACEVLTVAFAMVGEVYSRVGASLPVEIWKSTVVVLRKVMDILASKSLLMEDNTVAKFYVELLQCLHLVLAEPRGYLAEHVAGFVASLRIFFRCGLVNKPSVMNQQTNHMKGVGSTSQNIPFEVSNQPKSRPSSPYRPPHLRKKVAGNQQSRHEENLASSRHEFISSDSDCSDNDGSVIDNSKAYLAKARLAAIICVQDLSRADPKLFTAQWTMLLPSNDVLQYRKYDTTLMSCFLSDPSLKVRIAAASTIMAMLDGPASVSLQVAELKEHSRHGSFTTLSSSLGHILMQLHSGTLHVIKHETSDRLLALSFKILMLLIASTPYSRMPPELLSRVISSLQSTVEQGFPYHNDRNSLLAAAIICLTRALSVSPSMHVNNMLLGEISAGCFEGQSSGVLCTLFRYSEQLSTPSISLEALQVLDESLRAISGFKGTEDLSTDKSLDSPFMSDYVKTKAISSAPSYSLEIPVSTIDDSKTYVLASERWLEATIKHVPLVINHSSAMVRAASVTCFAGMTSPVFNSLPEDKQEYIIVSSINAALNDEVPSVRSAACRAIGVIGCFPQIYHRVEVLEKFILAAERNTRHSLVSVRITASWALANISDSLSHCLDALYAGRGSIGSTKYSESTSLLVDSMLRLARDNDKQVATSVPFFCMSQPVSSQTFTINVHRPQVYGVIICSLVVKANAVRGLGNLARSIQFTKHLPVDGDPLDSMHSKIECHCTQGFKDHIKEKSQSVQSSSGSFDWLDQMVQAFLSCVTTGNVKVQWNVCHALSNLFLNKSLKLQDMDWSSSVFSILLLLLRDSSNFKIRIQAVSALAVPETINDYGKSYYDVVKSVQHVLENFKSDQISEPSNFKYRIALEKQLTSTMLHLLGLTSKCDQQAIQDLLVKKASFLEIWIEGLCSSVGDTSSSVDEAKHASVDQKKDVIRRTIQSLVKVYESSKHHLIAHRFEKLAMRLL
ncbi:HEAT repeat-containing protein 6-like isoform X5 [Salvia splendens]|uniref:HEAT repeat-containing protein 6-like isoform X5 n=1 Tax=Salvia splendens TaxID=180675 RepID=UPI001C26EAC7|nr:HEAT repeat-containing protein 6-like isoform X5 [Salvia splendens]